MKQGIILSLLLILCCSALHAANNDTIAVADTTAACCESTTFRPTKLILPGVMMGIGFWGLENDWVRHQDHLAKHELKEWRHLNFFRWDNQIQYLPTFAYLGLPLLGVKPKHTFKQRCVIAATTMAAMAVSVYGIKKVSNEMRPDSTNNKSFPSGHTATAFAGAEMVRLEYGGWYGAGAYVAAIGVGFLRAYNNRHWLNDVVGGAGFGILSARLAYWLYPLESKWFKLDGQRKRTSAMIVPFYQSDSHALGCQASIVF